MPASSPKARKKARVVKGLLKDLPLAQAVRLPELQMRSGGTDEAYAQELAAVIKAGVKLPRIQVRRVEGMGDLVTDGFHTCRAHELAGKKAVKANILRGTYHDAYADALRANVQHDRAGKKRTPEDKKRVVEGALARFPDWSARKVAEWCEVSHTFVNDVRARAAVGGNASAEHPEKPLESGPPVETLPPEPVGDRGTHAWRDTPAGQFLDVPDYVTAALQRNKVRTAGDLFDQIIRGCRFGLKDTTVRDLLHEVQQLPGFDGRMQEAVEAAPPKSGTPVFDWKKYEAVFGPLVRLVDEAGTFYGAKDSLEFKGLHRLLSEFQASWDRWAKDLKKEAA